MQKSSTFVTLRLSNAVGQAIGAFCLIIFGIMTLLLLVFDASSMRRERVIFMLVYGLCLLLGGIFAAISSFTKTIANSEGISRISFVKKDIVRWNQADAYVYEKNHLLLLNLGENKTLINLKLWAGRGGVDEQERDRFIEFAQAKLNEVGAEKYTLASIKRKRGK